MTATSASSVRIAFNLTDRVAVITGGAGMLGVEHAEAVAEMGAVPVLLDLDGDRAGVEAERIATNYRVPAIGVSCDITQPDSVRRALGAVMGKIGRIDILINNAARNPHVTAEGLVAGTSSRFESLPLGVWNADLSVGLTGAFLCCQVFGSELARQGRGVIVNIASDLAVIAPDQRIYRQVGLPDDQQPVKPVTYSVVKSGLVGLTRYLATYWADRGVRVNAISPGGVDADQDAGFVQRLSQLIPLGRMAARSEYRAAIVFLASDASSYMTGSNLIIDGGRSVW